MVTDRNLRPWLSPAKVIHDPAPKSTTRKTRNEEETNQLSKAFIELFYFERDETIVTIVLSGKNRTEAYHGT